MPNEANTHSAEPDELFRRYFWGWYSEESRLHRRSEGLFPDSYQIPNIPVRPEGYASEYGKEPSDRWAAEIEDFAATANDDFCRIIGTNPKDGIDSLGKIDEYFGRHAYEQFLAISKPEDQGNRYAVLCCLLGSYTGNLLIRESADLHWWVSGPMWDSQIVHHRTGMVAPVFHWAIRRLSEESSELHPKADWYLKQCNLTSRI